MIFLVGKIRRATALAFLAQAKKLVEHIKIHKKEIEFQQIVDKYKPDEMLKDLAKAIDSRNEKDCEILFMEFTLLTHEYMYFLERSTLLEKAMTSEEGLEC